MPKKAGSKKKFSPTKYKQKLKSLTNNGKKKATKSIKSQSMKAAWR